jgi:hypothetical protein
MAMNFVLGTFVYFFIPETKQVPLEEIDVLFGGASHKDKGTDLLEGRIPDGVEIGDEKAVHTKEAETRV